MMFRPFYSETELFEDDIDKCKDLFEESDIAAAITTPEMSKIEVVKRELFPHMVDVEEGREMVEKFEYEYDMIILELILILRENSSLKMRQVLAVKMLKNTLVFNQMN